MGYYIETDANKDKAKWLINNHDAKVITHTEAALIMCDDKRTKGVVCVVDNGPFEAAGYAFSFEEFESFLREDGRRKLWLSMDRDTAETLSNYSEKPKQMPELINHRTMDDLINYAKDQKNENH